MGMDTTAVRSPDHVLYRSVHEWGGVLLDLDRREYFALDDVAARMWEVLSETGTVSGIVERLVLEYDVDRPSLQADADLFVRTLAERDLVQIADI
jgi:hypothetical protein